MSRLPEPWMFGVVLTIDGRPVQGHVARITTLGRIRMALRVLRGKPAFLGTRIEDVQDA